MLKEISNKIENMTLNRISIIKKTGFKTTKVEDEFIKVIGGKNKEAIGKFIMESLIAEIDSLNDRLYELTENDLINDIKYIKATDSMLRVKYNNKEKRNEALERAYGDLQIGMEGIFIKSTNYINKIKDIDRSSELQKKYHWRTYYSIAKENAYLARVSLESIICGVACAKKISQEVDYDINAALLSDYQHYLDKIFDSDTLKILNNYDEDKSGFWLQIPNIREVYIEDSSKTCKKEVYIDDLEIEM